MGRVLQIFITTLEIGENGSNSISKNKGMVSYMKADIFIK
jgi:hypothetical protein